MNTRTVTIRCDDNAEAVVFNRYDYHDGDVGYEINIEDNYCGGDYMGIKGRFRRAWHAFWAKPIYYTGIYVDDPDRILSFFDDCLSLMEGET